MYNVDYMTLSSTKRKNISTKDSMVGILERPPSSPVISSQTETPAQLSVEILCDLCSYQTSLSFHPNKDGKISASFFLRLTCGRLLSHLQGATSSHPIDTTKTRDKHWLQWAA